jgi:hexokinase
VRKIAMAIGRRAARLSAVAIGAIVISSGRLAGSDDIDIGVDGSLVEFYPGFEDYMREA